MRHLSLLVLALSLPAWATDDYDCTVTSTGTSVNSSTVAACDFRDGSLISIQCDANAFVQRTTASGTTSSATGTFLGARALYYASMPSGAQSAIRYLAFISQSGTANCNVNIVSGVSATGLNGRMYSLGVTCDPTVNACTFVNGQTFGTATFTGLLTGASATFSGTVTSTAAAAATGFALSTNGALFDVGAGAADTISSSGTQILFGTTISVTGAGVFSGTISTTGDTFAINNATSQSFYGQGAGLMDVTSHASNANVSNVNAALTLRSDVALAANDLVLNVENSTGLDLFKCDVEGDCFVGGTQPAVTSHSATSQAIEPGSGAMTANALAVTFSTAFGAAPNCVCSHQNATPTECGVSVAANTTTVTFAAPSAGATDTLQWLCVGQR